MNLPPGIEALPNDQWVVAGDTHLGNWAKQHGSIITDPCLFQWLKPHLKGVKTAWDVGANIGDHTRQYLDWGMLVVAVEPNPQAFICLEHNCPEALCLDFAASDSSGLLWFTQLANVGASRVVQASKGHITVEALALDDVQNLPTPDFVKIDVEGFEVFALLGMVETLKRHKPIIFCEINRGALAENNHTPDDVRDFLRELGYVNIEIYPSEATWHSEQFDILVKP